MITHLLLAALAGCPGKADDTADTLACASGTIALTDANNYTASGTLDVPYVETASGVDIEVCWDALTEDIQCHDVDPLTDIDNLGLVRLGSSTEADVEAAIAANTLNQSSVSGYVEYPPEDGVTCANLADFSFFGTPVDVASEYTEANGLYMMLLTTGTSPGVGARMLQFLQPRESSDVTRVDVGAGCGVLDFEGDLEGLTPVCTGDAAAVMDWSGITVDSQGAAVDLGNIDGAMLGFYEGMSVADLESRFLDLMLIGTSTWTAELDSVTSVSLGELTDSSGAGFTGFSGDGTWLFALTCSRCSNPAPIFLTVVVPE